MQLAQDGRFADLVAGPCGRSLLMAQGLTGRDLTQAYEAVQAAFRSWATQHGTPEQRAASAKAPGLKALEKAALSLQHGVNMTLR